MRKLIIFAALLAIPRLTRAAETCLWLNQATAAGILGGPVSLQVIHPPHSAPATANANATSSAGPMNANASAPNYVTMSTDDEDCAFSRKDGATTSLIRIEVRTTNQSHTEFLSRVANCGKNKDSLRAIGNEAVACETAHIATSGSQQASEQIVGRVRDRVFVVRVAENDRANVQPVLREWAETAAQIVAGNLF